MTLTQNDLQQIRQVVHEAIQEETPKIVKNELTSAIDTQIRPVIREEIGIALKPVKRKLNRVAKDLNKVIGDYDDRITKNKREIDKLKQEVKELKQN